MHPQLIEPRPRSFVVLFEGRTGSTLLISSLEAHPRIRAFHEILTEARVGRSRVRQVRAICQALDSSRSGRIEAVGFKAKLRDVVDKQEFTQLLRKYEARVIYTVRRNAVKQAISWVNALRLYSVTGDWNLTAKRHRLPPFRVEPEELEERLRAQRKLEEELARYIASLDLPNLCVSYEDLLLNSQAVFTRVLDFLSVDPRPLRTSVSKNTPDDLRNVLVNFDELRSHYVGTYYEAMFDEVLVPSS